MTTRDDAARSRTSTELRWDAEEDGLCALPLRVLRPVDWEFEEERKLVRIHMDRNQRDTWYRPVIRPILESLDDGVRLPDIVRALEAEDPDLSRKRALRLARSFLHGLAVQGNIEVTLPPVPEVFHGRFKRESQLGRGGVGVAWLCRDLDRDDHPEVVVKHAWNWTGDFAKKDGYMRDEAALMARFDHPQVVAVIDCFEIDERFHLARDFVRGTDLGHYVLRKQGLAPADRRTTIAAIADIMAHVHERGVLCLDASPTNFIVPGEGAPQDLILSDVGHFREMDNDGVVRLEAVWGTRDFVSPEVREHRVASIASDVHSLGSLYSFLTTQWGRRDGEAVKKVLRRMEEAGASEPERAFVGACMRDDPTERPDGPREALDLLDAA